jgi:ribonuclease Z
LDFELTILGSNSAIAQHGRYPTSHLLQIHNQYYLIDCGEGTQDRLKQYVGKWFRINYVFISHLHGDHYYGLIGLLTTFNLLKRTEKLTIFAPHALEKILQLQFDAAHTQLTFPLEFIVTQDNALNKLVDNSSVDIYSFPLEHKLPTTGFLFVEKKHKRKLNMEKLAALDINPKKYKLLQDGLDIEDEHGNFYPNEELTLAPKPPRKFAFCSDTQYTENIIKYIAEVDLLYHEATFMEDAAARAAETKHSTAMQAASIAQKAKVKKLLIGHFSSRYKDLKPLHFEAKSIFEPTFLSTEGLTVSV